MNRIQTLKRIAAKDLRLGMYVHDFDSPWLDHAFWRTRFLLAKPADLERICASGIETCWIDTSKGRDVEPSAPPPAATPPQQPEPATVRAATPPLGIELERAATLIAQAREVVASVFQAARMGRAIEAEGCRPLVDEIALSIRRHAGAFINLARLTRRDDVTYLHSVAVCGLMIALGRELGLDDEGCRAAGLAGLLHDVGKALVPLEVLNKPGALSDAEFSLMRLHPEQGWDLLKDGQGVLETTLDVCLHHHERMDGRGYPHRLVGEQISLIARMGAVCDVYDAVTSDRPYRDGWDPADALASAASTSACLARRRTLRDSFPGVAKRWRAARGRPPMPEVCSLVAALISPIRSVPRLTCCTISPIVLRASSTRRLPASTFSTLSPISF